MPELFWMISVLTIVVYSLYCHDTCCLLTGCHMVTLVFEDLYTESAAPRTTELRSKPFLLEPRFTDSL